MNNFEPLNNNSYSSHFKVMNHQLILLLFMIAVSMENRIVLIRTQQKVKGAKSYFWYILMDDLNDNGHDILTIQC